MTPRIITKCSATQQSPEVSGNVALPTRTNTWDNTALVGENILNVLVLNGAARPSKMEIFALLAAYLTKMYVSSPGNAVSYS